MPPGGSSALPRSLTWFLGALTGAVAATVAAVLAIVFALVLFVCVLVTALLVAANAARSRMWRRVRPARAGDLIDAKNVGGHSWIAYGWDGRS